MSDKEDKDTKINKKSFVQEFEERMVGWILF
jgi:hypothetical protein